MGFARKPIEKWNDPQVNSFQAKSDKYGFETNINGLDFENHPFKISFISSTAPPLQYNKIYLPDSLNNSFTMTVKMKTGYIYDISRYQGDIRQGLYISKKKDGRYLALGYNIAQYLTEAQLASMRVPVMINNVAMTDETPITFTVKTNGAFSNVEFGWGMLFLAVTFQDLNTVNGNNTAAIKKANILTKTQIETIYPNSVVSQNGVTLTSVQKRTTRIIPIYSSANSQYFCLNSARAFLSKTSVPVESYSVELKKALADEAAGGDFRFFFQPRPSPIPVLKNDLFLQIK